MKIAMIGWAGCVVLLAGCGGPTVLRVKGVKPMNENDLKESTPVDIRIFQLKDDARFKQAPIENLWTKAKEALSEDWVAEKRATVFPGVAEDQPRDVVLGTLETSTRFVGILALFPKEDDKATRKVVVPAGDAGSGIFELRGYHITWVR
ncbi:MAG TPA: type VI secretion system lipoprotein TssJ [Planctomycetota bacterium]|nr:type VI secretion system lipoprotein TssJ [Planctomycetota bacterium]